MSWFRETKPSYGRPDSPLSCRSGWWTVSQRRIDGPRLPSCSCRQVSGRRGSAAAISVSGTALLTDPDGRLPLNDPRSSECRRASVGCCETRADDGGLRQDRRAVASEVDLGQVQCRPLDRSRRLMNRTANLLLDVRSQGGQTPARCGAQAARRSGRPARGRESS
jgi:hypothetical protein